MTAGWRTYPKGKLLLIAIPLIVALSLLGGIPAYYVRYGDLSGPPLGQMALWRDLVLFLVPVMGIAALTYGALTRDYLGAFLVGVVPYVPGALLGSPAPIVVLAVPMGAMGAGPALVRRGIGSPQSSGGLVSISGILLFSFGFLWWLLLWFGLHD
jgi:hypothetical protein